MKTAEEILFNVIANTPNKEIGDIVIEQDGGRIFVLKQDAISAMEEYAQQFRVEMPSVDTIIFTAQKYADEQGRKYAYENFMDGANFVCNLIKSKQEEKK